MATSEVSWSNMDEAFMRAPVREMAVLLALENTGTELEESSWEAMCVNVAAVADEFSLNPDEVQQLLEMHDATLEAGKTDWFSLIAQIKAEESQDE